MSQAIPIIAAIIGAAGVGTSIYSLTNQPGAPKPPAPPTPAQSATTSKNNMAAISSEFPGIQAQTGGSLSPEAWIQISQLLQGKAGDPGFGAAGQDLLQKLNAGPGLTPAGSSFG